MRKTDKKLNQFDFFISLLQILETKRPPSFISRFAYHFAILLYFGQMFSYLIKLNFQEFNDLKLIFSSRILFYMNFGNFLYYFKKKWMTLVVLIIAHILCYFIPVYIIIKTYLQKKKKLFFSNHIWFFSRFDLFTQKYLIFYNWAFNIVLLEIFINIVDCDWYNYFLDSENVAECQQTSKIILFFSIIGSIFCVIQGILNIMLFKSYEFYVERETIPFKFNNKGLFLFIHLIRCLLPICYPFLKDYHAIYLLFFFAIIFLSFIDFFLEFPMRDNHLNNTYISCLFVFSSFVIVIFFWEFTGLIAQESMFYLCLVLMILLIKVASSTRNLLYYNKILINDFDKLFALVFISEEIFMLHYDSEFSRKDRFLCFGLMKNHAKNCINPECKLKLKHLKNLHDNEQTTARLIKFIIQSFAIKIKGILRKRENVEYFERFMLKYITFLLNSHKNCLKAYYAIQKIKSSNIKTYSFHFRIIYKILKKNIKEKLKKTEFERTMKTDFLSSNELAISDFFKINQEKQKFEFKIKKLIIEKQKFWERFKDGFKSYEDLIKYVYSLIEKIKSFENFLSKSSNSHGIVILKCKSILYAILLNSINEAIKFEDEIDNFKKRYFTLEKESLTPLSFFKKEIAVCQVSFLNTKGLLLESTKTHKLAAIFDYELIDLKNIKYITQLMPYCLASHHEEFVRNSFEQQQSQTIGNKKQISSLAINKKGFVLKIKVFFSQSFQYESDFVMNAGIMKLEETSQKQSLIFDSEGFIQGMNEGFFQFFNGEYNSEIDLLDYNLLNIYALIPKLREILFENNLLKEKTNQTLRNETATFGLPDNLKEILEKLRNQKKEGDQSDYNNSVSRVTVNTMKTAKSSKSKNSNSNYNNIGVLGKSQLTNILALSSEQIILQTINELKQFKINFDLVVNFYNYGKKQTDFISIFTIILLKVVPLKKETLTLKLVNTNSFLPLNKLIEKTLNLKETNEKYAKETTNILLKRQATVENLQMKEDDFSVNENPTNFVHLPPDNSVLFRNFGRKMNENLLEEEERKINENFINDLQNPSSYSPRKDSNMNNLPENSDEARMKINERKIEKILLNEEKTESNDFQPKSTENRDLPDLLEKISQKASSVTSMKKTFQIFSTIKKIQKRYPISVKNITLIMISETILLVIYMVILYYLSNSYLTNKYIPLQESMINFCRSSVDFNFGVMVVMKYEIWSKGIINMTASAIQLNEYNYIINESISNTANVMNKEMNKPNEFAYQTLLKTLKRTFVDHITKQISNRTYFDMMTSFLTVLKVYDNSSPEEIKTQTSYSNILQRNYYYFYQINNNLITSIQNDFMNSHNIVTDNFQVIMIVLISISAAFGMIKFLQFNNYNSKIMKILNILLRMQPAQIFNELGLYKEMQKIFEDPFDSYLNIYFSEQSINSKNLGSEETKEAFKISQNNLKMKKEKNNSKYKTIKKTSLSNIKPLSKIRSIVSILVIFSISFAVFYSNYYMWTISDSSITDLINININFNKLYYYSAFLLVNNNLMIREKIIRDPEYENSGEITQTSSSRLNSLNTSFIRRLKDFNGYITSISNYGVAIQQNFNNPIYDEILQGNICKVLLENGYITPFENAFCVNGLNKAFMKGLPGLLNEYRNRLLTFANMTDLVVENDTFTKNLQVKMIKDYMNNGNQTDMSFGGLIVCKSVLAFYNKIMEYYFQDLKSKINLFVIFLLTTCCFCCVFFIVSTYWSHKFLKKVYLNISCSLMLIPYEKLVNDEQINFLIKQIAKDR